MKSKSLRYWENDLKVLKQCLNNRRALILFSVLDHFINFKSQAYEEYIITTSSIILIAFNSLLPNIFNGLTEKNYVQ